MGTIERAAEAAGVTQEQARSVVAAIRTPTGSMMDAGLYQASHDATSADVYSSWVDMIDAVLNE